MASRCLWIASRLRESSRRTTKTRDLGSESGTPEKKDPESSWRTTEVRDLGSETRTPEQNAQREASFDRAANAEETEAKREKQSLEINDAETGLSRDHLVDILRAENVRARRYFYPGCHRLEPYCSSSPSGLSLPVTEKVLQRVLCLPTGTGITPAEVSQICRIIRFVIENAKEVREEMERQRAVIA